MNIIKNDTVPFTAVNNANATVFNDDFYFVSDGSININLTVFP